MIVEKDYRKNEYVAKQKDKDGVVKYGYGISFFNAIMDCIFELNLEIN